MSYDPNNPSGDYQGGPPQGGGGNVSDYTIISIVELLCCCLPAGIVGLIYSINAKNKLKIGDYSGAASDAATAKKWLIIGAIVGAIVISLYLLFWVVLGVFGESIDPTTSSY